MERQMIVGKFSVSKIIAIILAFLLFAWGIPASMGDKGGVAKAAEPFDNATALTIGTPVNVAITSSDQIVLPDEGKQILAKAYSANLTQGINYEFVLTHTEGDDFDPMMYLYDSAGDLVDRNDDYYSTINSKIVFTPEATGTYYLVCSEYYGEEATLTLNSRTFNLVDVTIEVTDSTNPLEGIEVSIYNTNNDRVYTNDTDASGECSLSIEPANYTITFRDPESFYAYSTKDVTITTSDTITHEMSPYDFATLFSGATPLTIGTDATVDLSASLQSIVPPEYIDPIECAIYKVNATEDYYYEFILQQQEIYEFIPGLYIYDQNGKIVGSDQAFNKKDARRGFKASATGSYYIVCTDINENSPTFTLLSSSSNSNDFVEISGKVYSNATPLEDIEVSLLDDFGIKESTTTGSDGDYSFNVAPGTYSLTFTDPDDKYISSEISKRLFDKDVTIDYNMPLNEISQYFKYAQSITFNQFMNVDLKNLSQRPHYNSSYYMGQLYKGSFTKGFKNYIELNKTNIKNETKPLIFIFESSGKLVQRIEGQSKLNGNCYYEFTPNASGTYYFLCADDDWYIYPMQFRITTTVNINFDSTGGKKVASKQIKFGTSIGKLSNPTKKGHTFKGWYTAKKGGKKINNGAIVNNSFPSTLYAQWNKISVAKASLKKVSNVKKNKAKITIKKVKNAKGYQITYSTNKKFKKAKSINTTKLTATISKLKKGKTYYVKVRAYGVDSTKAKVYGKYGSSKKIKIKK